MSTINERAMLVTLNISMWTAAVGDSEAAKEAMRAIGADEKFESGSETGRLTKFLIDPKALAPGNKLAGAARKQHKKLTSPYSDDSTRIIAGAGYRKYMDGMAEAERDFWNWYQHTFKPAYPGLVAKARTTRKGDFRLSEYPDAHLIDIDRGEWRDRTPSTKLDRKFGFAVTPAPVPEANHFSNLIGVSAADMALIQQSAMNDANARIERAVNDVWQRLLVVVEAMVERLTVFGTPLVDENGQETGKRAFFLDTLVTNITGLLDLVPILNVTADPEITATAREIEQRLTQYSPQVLRSSPQIRTDVLRSATQIMSSIRGTRRIVARAA
jgi:hypothetical protein